MNTTGWITTILIVLGGGIFGVLKGKPWWGKRKRRKATIKAEEKRLDEEKEARDAEREDRRAAAHDACPFDE